MKLTHGLGSRAMKSKYFPMFLVDLYFVVVKNSKRHKNMHIKYLTNYLSNVFYYILILKKI